MGKSSLPTPDRVKLPKEIRRRIIDIATTIAATITDNRIKTILSSVCTAYRADWMQDRLLSDTLADIRPLTCDERDEVIRTGFCDIPLERTAPRFNRGNQRPPKFVTAGWRRRADNRL
jgi:hypothetical protein